MSPQINEPIAIVGSACRFPGGSSSPSKLWDLLKNPRDVLGRIDRFKAESYHHVDGHHHGASNVLDAYLLEEDTRTFDTQFFSIQAGEAESIDPQQRVLLESVYEGIESAGLTVEGLQGTPTAVYVGLMCDDYNGIAYHDGEAVPKYAATGTARSIMSNRVSYFFNWTGPSMTIDTACSSSLVAVHQAVQTLRSGESRVAVAAGANLIFAPKMFIAESNLNMLSPTGRSRMWDAGADGYARGEGIASVVLKTLSAAIADGDNIECIIRETGVNQDGRTPGITMPSSTAQAALIRQTYAKAGLDLNKKTDRPQYFEAHGTGTKAGDPQEAGAIFRAFYDERGITDPEDILHVGSIKTVIGHTEGTAGLAGLIKASLAIQNKTIPPNMHFNTLNPDLEPYYGHLQIPTEAKAWPELPDGTPRRASVNSFGFGGTNAHAIIEDYVPSTELVVRNQPTPSTAKVAIPFTFSAPSEKALATQLNSYLAFLRKNPEVDLKAMAWTLSRRSAFNFRTTVSAVTLETLTSKIESKLEAKTSGNTPIGVRQLKDGQGILGVFTGQGAQWAAMARELILSSSFVEDIIDELESSLAELPTADRPTFSLKAEMLKQGKESRIAEGLLSQPLCTAVQVVLVNLLRNAGVKFEAVVGHSSGEIGAAYAAGYISASDAIRIAYYRGFYAKLAKGPNGEKGSMLAAGTSIDDANELCQLPTFEGRMQVAASNSSSSVTLSGDEEAIEEALEILKDEGKFARQLKVDTAYHSHHMIPCSEAYTKSLEACKIEILTPPKGSARWYSSVFGGKRPAKGDGLESTYWMKNMLQPVLFSQALTEALASEDIPAIAMEVGPHPALKGPASGTIEEVLGHSLPYAGTLSRGTNDVESLADTLGFLWTSFGPSAVNFAEYRQLFANADTSIMKSLPTYKWDHDRVYFYESRTSRVQRLRKDPTHELLGVRMDDEEEGEYRWRNYIKPNEIPWLSGHLIQGQPLFPAAGFAVMAVEASKVIVPASEVALVELHNFSIHRALAFPDETAGAEILFTLSTVTKGDGIITANFTCSACSNRDSGTLESMSNGQLVLRLGEPSSNSLPDRPAQPFDLKDVDVDEFYDSLAVLGYNYNGPFRGISQLQRAMDISSGTMFIPTESDEICPYTIHPTTLDVGFQALFGSVGAPGDGRLWTLHVPTTIDRIKINPTACPPNAGLGVELPFNTGLAPQEAGTYGFTGDVAIYDEAGKHCLVQCESLRVSALARPNEASDRHIFSETLWDLVEPDVTTNYKEFVENDLQARTGILAERACLFYLKQLHETITPEEREKCDSHRKAVLNWAEHIVSLTAQGAHPILKQEWINDTAESLKPILLKEAEQYEDWKNLLFVGETMIPFVRGEVNMLEEFQKHDMLDWLYKETDGTRDYNAYLGGLVKQIAHRFPYMNILEIGAGTGSATEAVIKSVGHSYASYTYTDISDSFFPEASKIFADHSNGFVYKVLDATKDVAEQGFVEGGYDLIVASNVLHATPYLDETLANTRKLLKPGGYLIMLEITETDWLRLGFLFSGMSGWWAGADDGRPYTPLVSTDVWDGVFRRTGFSGIDTVTPPSKSWLTPFSVMLTQAVDTEMSLIRQPLSLESEKPIIEKLLILGGQEEETYDLAEEVQEILKSFYGASEIIDKLEDIDDDNFSSKHTVLCLAELDEPAFKPFSEAKYKAVQTLMDQGQHMLWVVKGANGENPYSRMMIGVGRCMEAERKDGHKLQFIDMDLNEKPNARMISEALLRMHIVESWKNNSYNPLWTLELEQHAKDGKLSIPRYQPCSTLDRRYNSNKRLIKDDLVLGTGTVAICNAGASFELEEHIPQVWEMEASRATGLVVLRVRRSVLSAIKIKSVGYLHLVVAEDVETKEKVLALTDNHRSTISVPKTWTTPITVTEEEELDLLVGAATELVADAILSKLTGSLLVHEPSVLLAQALSRKASETKATVSFTTAKGTSSFHHIHPSTPQTVIDSHIPKNVSAFIDLSAPTDADGIGARIERQLPAKCKVKHSGVFLGQEGFARQTISDLSEILKDVHARSRAQLSNTSSLNQVENILLEDIENCAVASESLRTVDWTAKAVVPVKQRLAEKKVEFRGDKTYFMIGLSGDLGLSICRWMIEHGARYIVITSRNPKVEQSWLDTMAAKGATVKVWSMDITSKSSVRKVHKLICETLPPIAGVANGAMILKDGLLSRMPYEQFGRTLKPKVDGSIFLDELFSKNNLDFFILFSSLAYLAGNVGQAPYAAANGFMVAMAEGRRKRGLAGSVMNLAGITGVGYIDRFDKGLHDSLDKMGYTRASEWDAHQFFAEAVIASHPDSGRSFEISNGVKSFDVEKDTELPFWINIPRFAHYKVIKASAADGKDSKRTVSMRAQLKEQTTEEGVIQILLNGFLGVLYNKLNMLPEDNGITTESSLVELGIDSLVAVDMRSWFHNELDLDMPVLKILGGATVGAMVEDAFERLSRDLIPNFKAGEGDKGEGTASVKPTAKLAGEGKGPSGGETSESSSIVIVSEEEASQGTLTPPTSTDSPVDGEKDDLLEVQPMPTFIKTERMAYGASQFWFLGQYLEDPTHFNIQFTLSIKGALDIQRMELAIEGLGRRHEAFRTAFFGNPDRLNEPTQGVIEKSDYHLVTKKIHDISEVEVESQRTREYVYDIERADVARATLLSLTPKHNFMIFGFHHIITDGFTFNLFLTELNALYQGNDLPPVGLQYSDLAAKQRREVEDGSMATELDFFKKQFAKVPDTLPLLPVAQVKSRRTMTCYAHEEGDEIKFDTKTIAQIKNICRKNGSTKFHFFLTCLKVFLFRMLDVDDICIGMADANRNERGTDSTMGYLLNLLPLRFERNNKQHFADAIKESRDKSYAALAHSRLPFDVLLEHLNVPRSSTNSPLFQVLMDYRQFSAKMPLLDAEDYGEQLPSRTASDLILDISDVSASDLRVNFKTQAYLYSRSSTQILVKSFAQLVRSIADNSTKINLDNAPLFDPLDIKTAMDLGRGQDLAPEWPGTISHRIEDLGLADPDSIALKDDETILTYGVMANRVNAITAVLLGLGVSEGSIVAVFQEPTVDWICSLLAIWKAGGTFVPLEARNGMERLAMIANDCQPSVILCHEATMMATPELKTQSAEIVNVTTIPASKDTILNRATPDSIAMIVYSSGTTGTPKGVKLHHEAIRNNFQAVQKAYNLDKDVILQQTAYSFDLAIAQVVYGLGNGGTLYVVPKSKRLDAPAIADLIVTEGITYTMATPSEYFSWLRHNAAALAESPHWKRAMSCGEALTKSLVEEFWGLEKPNLRLLNLYGPSEITFCSHYAEIEYQSTDAIPIGHALPNYQTYIVDKNLNLLPVGVSGEIVIGGAGVSKGYFNNDQLTQSQFIPNKYSPSEQWPVVYRTGDVGRLEKNGNLMYEGRLAGDTQIKLRGIRIEMRDIESTIVKAAEGNIFKAVASVRGDPGFLVAHVEFATGFPESERDDYLKTLLTGLPLPKYMCPAMIIALDAIPLNSHSKIDRRAVNNIPLPILEDEGSNDTLSETELALKQVWVDVVSKDIGTATLIHGNTDFFNIGGNSLLLVKLQATIRERFDVVVPMTEMFEASTLRNMASKIDNSTSADSIDWTTETSLEHSLFRRRSVAVTQAPSTKSGLTVLLTGSTGYLGRHFLKQLVSDDRVTNIHAVAVRKDNPKNMPRDILQQSPKIIVHEGNLSDPMLGLSEATFTSLANEVDVIIHSGADRSFSDYYQVLRGSNFWSTRELAKLALSRRIPLHFISSGGLVDPSTVHISAGSVTGSTPPNNGSNGYLASKWASEAYLENASQKLGLPVRIHRVTSTPADKQQASPDIIKDFADLSTFMEKIPDQDGWNGSFDLISAGPLAQQVCNSALEVEVDGESTLSVVHYPAEARLNMQDVQKSLDEYEHRSTFESLAPHVWVGAAKQAGISWHFASMDLTVGGTGFVLKR